MRAMILAAGRGERMRPLTDTTPKPLLRAGGKPLIVWHIERLVGAGITNLIINHAWLGHQIEAVLKDGRQWGATITYSPEATALETAGGIAHARPALGSDPFLVINGDVWCDWNPGSAFTLGKQLLEQKKQAWLLLVDNPAHHPDGDFALDVASSQITLGRPALTFAGIGLYQPALFEGISAGQAAPLGPLLRFVIENGQAIGHHYTGTWVDVGTPDRLHTLNHQLSHL